MCQAGPPVIGYNDRQIKLPDHEPRTMGGEDDLLRAIEHVKSGDLESAVALLRVAVDDPDLDEHGRAVACIWLAETGDDIAFKISCLEQSLRYEPGNPQVQRKLDQLRARQPQPHLDSSALTSAPSSLRMAQAPPVLGIDGGANVRGSGIFVNRAGLVATTAYVVGSALEVAVTFGSSGAVPGQVLRRYPESDLALIGTAVALGSLDALENAPAVIANEAVTALAYNGAKIRGTLQDPGDGARQGWLRTSILIAMSPDAGGSPLYDGRGHALGLLTRNADHDTGRAWAVSLPHILTLAEQTTQEYRLLPNAATCGSCGCRAQAGHYGGRYCETCGARLASAGVSTMDPPDFERLAQLYGEDRSRPCPHCAARTGYYAGRCLRCSGELAPKSPTT
ncbi:MAG: serine protease [Chloroflexi bacterium]|nr:serine protease [Chloroflexota bacterium]